MYSGADFIKTSTGKESPAATPEAAYVMCQAIKEYFLETGRKVGFKPAGGINSVHDALVILHHRKRAVRRRMADQRAVPSRYKPHGQLIAF